LLAGRALLCCRLHGLLEGVEGGGADVAVDHPDGAQRQRPEVLVLGAVPGVPGRGGRLMRHIGGSFSTAAGRGTRRPEVGAAYTPALRVAEVNRGNIGAGSCA